MHPQPCGRDCRDCAGWRHYLSEAPSSLLNEQIASLLGMRHRLQAEGAPVYSVDAVLGDLQGQLDCRGYHQFSAAVLSDGLVAGSKKPEVTTPTRPGERGANDQGVRTPEGGVTAGETAIPGLRLVQWVDGLRVLIIWAGVVFLVLSLACIMLAGSVERAGGDGVHVFSLVGMSVLCMGSAVFSFNEGSKHRCGK